LINYDASVAELFNVLDSKKIRRGLVTRNWVG